MLLSAWFCFLGPQSLDPGKSVRELGAATCVVETVFRNDGAMNRSGEKQPCASFFVFLFCWPAGLRNEASETQQQFRNDAAYVVII